MKLPSPSMLAARGLLCLGLAWMALPAAGLAANKPPTLSAQEQAFVAKATADDSMQIALAQVALDRSRSPRVRALAQRIIDDHRALNRKFTRFSVAKKAHGQSHGVPARDVTKDKLRLQQLKGDDLDKTFADMMVKEHEKIIPLYRHAAKDSGNAGLQRIAREGLPMLEDHLRAARAIAPG